MSANKDKRTLSKEEIRAYLDGKVKGKAAHELERHLLNDPFDQEAMDGFELVSRGELEEDLFVLERQIQQQEKRRPTYWLRFAATVTVLLVSVFVVWFTLDQYNDRPKEIGMNSGTKKDSSQSLKKEPMKQIPEPAPVIEEEFETPTADKPLQKKEPQLSPSERVVARQPQSESLEDMMAKEESLALEVAKDRVVATKSFVDSEEEVPDALEIGDVLQDEIAGVDVETDDMESIPSSNASAIRVRGSSSLNKSKKTPLNFTVSGVVTDESGEPVPGVNVIENNLANGTSTDIDGKYMLNTSVKQPYLIFSFIGMVTQEVKADSLGHANLEMEADVAALSEVVVTGYGVESSPEEITYERARPKNGYSDYKKYLQDHLKYPKKAQKQGVEGKVVLAVYISAKGEIVDVEINKSLGHGCDEEAIRLVKEGPVWQPAKRNGQQVSDEVWVKVKFKLP